MQKGKVAELNLEAGLPLVEEALKTLTNGLTTYKKMGYKAVIVIHGYGSSGTGGSIKAAVSRHLGEKSLCGIVRGFVSGEDWALKKREYIGICNSLDNYERNIANNAGVTVVLLKK